MPELPLSRDFDEEAFSLLYVYAGNNPTNYIDPLGLLRFKGCTPDQETAIDQAFKTYCEKARGPSFTGCMCASPSIAKKLDRACDDPNRTVRCKDNSTGRCSGACGWSIPFGRTIRVCPSGWNTSLCGPLGCTLLHEMTHQIGHPFEKRPEQVEKCLGCP